MASVKSTLFYTSALLNLLIIPKHLKVGATNVSKAIATIPEESPAVKRGKEVVRTAWDLTNSSLAILGKSMHTNKSTWKLIVIALLNYRWAKNSGPGSLEEKLMIVSSVLGGWYVGCQYFRIGMYVPLSVLWVAPAASLLAWLW